MEWSLNSNSKQSIMYRRCALFFCCISLVICGCNSKKPTVPLARYFYYPKTNVYFDAHLLNYTYSLDSGRTWQTMQSDSSATKPLSLGGEVELKNANDNPWEDNISHRSIYGGALYNVITRDTVLLADNIQKDTRKSAVKTQSPPPPKKKKNIFQKIFGKKKNNNE